MLFIAPSLGLTAVLIGAVLPSLLLIYGFTRFYAARAKFLRLQKAGSEVPSGYSFLWGHLGLIASLKSQHPPDAITDVAVAQLARDFPGGLFYLDFWPFSYGHLVIASGQVAAQMEKHEVDLPHGDDIDKPLDVMCGGRSLVTMSGDVWRQWRKLFNSSFSERNMLEMAAGIAREVEMFCGKLRERAGSGEVFELEQLTADLTMDVIGSMALGTRLCHQHKENPLAADLRTQADWIAFNPIMGPWKRWRAMWSPSFRQRNRRIRDYVGKELDKRFAELQDPTSSTRSSKSIISHALANYLETTTSRATNNEKPVPLEPTFRKTLTSQTLLFLTGGHETTSTTLIFIYHNLSTSPTSLSRLRAEHTAVFGPCTSPSHILSLLASSPELLSQLPFTLAVIRETLRLYPPAGGIRVGSPLVNLVDDNGKVFPTAGLKIWTNHLAIHRNPRDWKDPHRFWPERWLAREGEAEIEMAPKKGAWRPFEWGPRSCLGQTLAMMELRIVLLMTAREFDIKPAYAEDAERVWGSQAYMTAGKGVGAKPNAGYPCTVGFASKGDGRSG
ncbi:cytochrome P450 monooxygenase [Trematosphaeria pertusa]|uniref:Cytochrome P450 monooxygenase n=1 Tax=Trematosphaeria pertusa TaxID=390896 RepID=A0A6A6ITI8_9PLEO|nr:cytochrome P450 monooxygenase [Trematosphaeria pertusa]KAF2253716.1 cytochrome P450 monooxygenase [Trematosphaeria pertusa]